MVTDIYPPYLWNFNAATWCLKYVALKETYHIMHQHQLCYLFNKICSLHRKACLSRLNLKKPISMYWHFYLQANLSHPFLVSFLIQRKLCFIIVTISSNKHFTLNTKRSIKSYCIIQVLKLIRRTTLRELITWTVVPVDFTFWNHTGKIYFPVFYSLKN